MKNLLIKLSIAVITLSIGLNSVFCYNFWFKDLPDVKVSDDTILYCQFAPKKVSVCQLMDFPDKYDNEWIVTEATIYFAANEYIVYPKDCNVYSNSLRWEPTLNLKDFKGLNSNLKGLLKNKKTFMKEVDVKIEGASKKVFNQFGDKYYLIIPDSIQIISPFRKFEPKGAA